MLFPSIKKVTTFGVVLLSAHVSSESLRSRADIGISVSEIYTDNRCLDKDGKESGWTTSINLDTGSGLAYSRQGARASLSIDGAVQLNTGNIDEDECNNTGVSTGNRFSPDLNAIGNIELIDQTLFVDVEANARQSAIDPFSKSDENNTSTRQNRNTTYSYTVSPYLKSRVKDFAEATLRLSYDDQYNSENEVEDSTEYRAILSINSISSSKFSWGLSGNYTRESYDQNNTTLAEEEDNDLASVSVNVGYQLNRKWQINATTGKDFNDFSSIRNDIEGETWDAGIKWTPNARTNLELGVGEKFFGSSNRFSMTHRHRRSNFSASYDKTLTSSRSLREEDVFFLLRDSEGNLFVNDIGQPLIFSTTSTTLTRSPIIDESLKLGYRLQGRRSSIGIDASESKQLRTEDNLASTFRDVSVSLNRTLSRNSSVNGRVTFRDRSADAGSEALGEDSESWIYTLGFSRDLGSKSTLSLDYTHTDRRSDDDNNEYKENRIIATIRVDF